MLAILQARCSSSRLPGKVLKPLVGEPMLARHIERLRRSRHISPLLVATSTDVSDDPLAALCLRLDVQCHRGSLDDVLDRFFRAAEPLAPEHLIRLTGDCPLADPDVIDATIGAGATNISGVRFDLKDRAAVEREALKMAVADARQRADAAAAGAGMKVERVLKIEEQRSIGGGPRPMMMTMASAAQEARATPVSPGEIEIRSVVTLTTAVR